MRPVPLGTRLTRQELPTAADTAAAIGNPDMEVVSTASLVAMLEHTSHLLVEPYYEPGERTVGTRVAIDHRAPAVANCPLMLTAELTERADRRLCFKVTATQDGREIVRGEHTRHVVEIARFLAPPPASANEPENPPGVELAFWFDFHSPWCYLACARIGDIARRHGATLVWRPVHLARLIDRIDGRRPLKENPLFVRWYRQDLQDWAELLGLEIRYHPDFPLRPARALRASLYATERGRVESFVLRVMRAYWREARDISDVEVLQRLADEVDLDPGPIPRLVSDPAYKARIEHNTTQAIAAGVFGVPAVHVQGKLFFGNDRLDLLDRYLSRMSER